jgi:hypothetical protein
MQVIAIYVFKDSRSADNALEQLWRCLDRGMERSGGYEIWLTSNCINPYLAGKICESLGGIVK